MFRNHACIDTDYREPWRWGAKNEAIIKKDIEHRYRLLPYIYSGFYQSAQSGLPISRTLAIDYTHDDTIYNANYQNQFLFGDSLMVCPVVSTQKKEDVYLPKGDWYRLSSDKKYDGKQVVNVKAPLTDLPVFVKASAIIPMQSVIQSTAEKGDGILQLHIWNGKNMNEFVYYEDDGSTYDHEIGVYYKRIIQFDPVNERIFLTIPEGSYKSKFDQIELVLHSFDKIKKIKVNDKSIHGHKSGKVRSFTFESFQGQIDIKY